MKRFQENIFISATSLIIVAIVVVVIFSFNQRQEIGEIAARLDHSHNVILHISSLYNKVVEHAGLARNYALSGDQTAAEKIPSTSQAMVAETVKIQNLLGNNPDQQPYLDSLLLYVHKRIDLSHQIIEIGKTKSLAEASNLYQTGLGRDYNNRILTITTEMQALEMTHLQGLEKQSADSLKKLNYYLAGLLVIILLLILIIIFKIRIDLQVRKQTESYLRGFNDELQIRVRQQTATITNVFERITDAFIALDKDFRYTYVNKKAGELNGRESVLLVGRKIWTVFPEFEKSLFGEGLINSMSKQEYVNLEEYYENFDRWIEYHIYPSAEGLSVFFRDITEKKQIENALRESEKKYRNLIEQALDAIFIADLNGYFMDVNSSTCNMFGYTKDELLRMNVADLLDKDTKVNDPPRFDLVAAGINVQRARPMLNKEGHLVETEFNAQKIDENRMMVVIRDVTELRKVQKQIQISEARFRGAFEFSDLGMGLVALDGRWIKVNKKLCQMTGYLQENLLEKSWQDIVDLRDREAAQELIRMTINGEIESYRTDQRFLHSNGETIWINLTSSLVKDNFSKPLHFVFQMEDITEKRRIEVELREAEEKFRNLVEQSLVGVYIIQDGKFAYVNPKFAEILGYAQDELVGKSAIETIKEFDREKVNENIRARIEGQLSSVHYEIVGAKKNGDPVDMELFGSRTQYKGKSAIIGTLIDITQRKIDAEKLIKERDLSNSIINSLPGVFFLVNKEQKILRWNRHFETITGYKKEEIAHIHPLDFFEGVEKSLVGEKIIEVFEKGAADIEATAITKYNDKVPFYFSSQLIEYEGNPCMIGTGIDITARKKAEEDLRESEQKYKLLFESNPMPMWMFSLNDLSIIDVNASAINHYGYSKGEFLQMKMKDISPDGVIHEYMSKSGSVNGSDGRVKIWKHKKKNGKIILEEVIGHNMIYQGQLVCLMLCNDVTEKIASEEKLKESYSEIRLLTKHLQKIREEERTHIAREIHDELGQQLTVLKMDASWLHKKVVTADDSVKEKLKSLREMLDTTVKSVRRISSELRPSLLDDLGLVAAIRWHMKEFGRRSGIKTEFWGDESEPLLPEETKTSLFRIYQESLTNVARHANATVVEIKLERKDEKLILSIKDNGQGFDLLTASGKKTLGLLGMKERVAMMEGNYEINSEPGIGTAVTVSVPFSN